MSQEVIMGELRELRKDVKELTGHFNGPNGVFVRLDRIEQREKTRRWLQRTAVGAAIGSAFVFVFELLKGGKS